MRLPKRLYPSLDVLYLWDGGRTLAALNLLCRVGYMVSRMLGAVPVLADSIVEQLCKASDKASDSHQHLGAQTEEDAAALSAAVWHSIWPVER